MASATRTRLGASRRPHDPADRLRRISFAAAVLAGASVVWIAATGRAISTNHGCVYDGVDYCAMASGRRGTSPFSHRVLQPWLVRLLRVGTVTSRFELINVVALIAVVFLTGVITERMARTAGASPRRARSGAVAASAAVVLVPFSFHLAVTLPVQTDCLALAFGLASVAAVTDTRPAIRWSAPALAALTVATRDAWLVPILIIAVLSARSRPRVAAATALAGVGALVLDLTRPSQPGGTSSLRLAGDLIHQYLRYPADLRTILWHAWLPVALCVILLVQCVHRVDRGARVLNPHDPLLRICVAVGVAHFLQSFVGGTDVSRIAWPEAPFLWSVGMAFVAAAPGTEPDAALALAGSVLVWRPFQVLNGSTHQYVSFYLPEFIGRDGRRMVQDVAIAGVTVLVWLVVVRQRRHQQPGTAPGAP